MYQYEDDTLATMSDAVREYAANVGFDRPDVAWILSPYDTWERNPYYSGPPACHPDDFCDDEFFDEMVEAVEAPEATHVRYEDDDIPF